MPAVTFYGPDIAPAEMGELRHDVEREQFSLLAALSDELLMPFCSTADMIAWVAANRTHSVRSLRIHLQRVARAKEGIARSRFRAAKESK